MNVSNSNDNTEHSDHVLRKQIRKFANSFSVLFMAFCQYSKNDKTPRLNYLLFSDRNIGI